MSAIIPPPGILIADDPFSTVQVPRLREFVPVLVREREATVDATADFASILRAILEARPAPPVTVPRRSDFFAFDSVSEYELRFPFANDPLYQEARNFMVAVWRIFSNRDLPFTLCRRNIKAPVHWVREVYRFLAKHGLINASGPKGRMRRWPLLVHVGDRIMPEPEYRARRAARGPFPDGYPRVSRLMSPAPADAEGRAELPGVRAFPLTPQEMGEVAQTLAAGVDNWATVAGHRLPGEMARILTLMPLESRIPRSVTPPSEQERRGYGESLCGSMGNDPPTPSPLDLIKEVTMRDEPSQRLVTHVFATLGDESGAAALAGRHVQPNSVAGAAALEVTKILAANLQTLESMHKIRIVGTLARAVRILDEAVQAKRRLFDM